jgi:small subunit ribosomal protein S8
MAKDFIGDFLTIIRNAIMASHSSVVVPYSRVCKDILSVLLQEGFIKSFSEKEIDGKKFLEIGLKFVEGESVIHELRRMSTPGRRLYARSKKIRPVIGGLGLTILTTSKGIMTDKQARQQSVGGEIICTIW